MALRQTGGRRRSRWAPTANRDRGRNWLDGTDWTELTGRNWPAHGHSFHRR